MVTGETCSTFIHVKSEIQEKSPVLPIEKFPSLVLRRKAIMLKHLISNICQVFAYGKFKAKENFKRLAALKVVAVAPPSECIWLLGVFVQVFWQSASLAVLKIQRFAILERLGPTLVLGGGWGGGGNSRIKWTEFSLYPLGSSQWGICSLLWCSASNQVQRGNLFSVPFRVLSQNIWQR